MNKINLEQLKQDLAEGQQIINDARSASRDDKLVSIYYACHAWGINRVMDMIDMSRSIGRLIRQKQK